MAFDTQAINKQRQNLAEFDEIWLFGYGSLIHKVDFPFIACENACIHGFQRRFWQGSHDHRGTPEHPGRVVTLIPDKGARCFGRAFKVNHQVFEHLDHREKNGYLRHEITIHLSNGHAEKQSVKGLVYIADADNAAYLGKASEQAIARQIFDSSGPSGANRDYVYELARALRFYNEVDEHVFKIEQLLRQLEKDNKQQQ